MALVKCEECKKDISDRAVSCPHCGAPVEKKATCIECGREINPKDKICEKCGCPVEVSLGKTDDKVPVKVEDVIQVNKNNKEDKTTFKSGARAWLIIGILACLAVSVFYLLGPSVFNMITSGIIVLDSGSNTMVNIMHLLSLLLGVTYFWLLKNCNKMSFWMLIGINALVTLYSVLSINSILSIFNLILVVINVFVTSLVCFKQLGNHKNSGKDLIILGVVSLVCIIGCVCSTSIVQNNYYDGDDYYIGGDQSDDNTTTTTRYQTPKQKISAYWTRIHGAACTDELCMYLFEAAGTQTYYTLDFNKKIYESDFFSSAGETYYKYDFAKDKGYGKMTVIAGYMSATVEINVTFNNDKGTYTYKWECDLNDCKDIVEDMAESIDGMRTDLIEDCEDSGISLYDLR